LPTIKKIKLITDSVSDLPKNLIEKYKIEIVPLTVHFGDDTYKDGIDIDSQKFFDLLKNSKSLPTTSQVSPGEFINAFEKYQEYEHIIVITLSSKLSGTYNSALQAKEIIGSDRITIIDSKLVSFSQGLIVLEVAKMIMDGMDYDEIISQTHYNIDHIDNIYIVDTLEYLQKGGRLSSTEAFVGNLLNIKPILTMSDGLLKSKDKVRGRKKAYKWIKDYIENEYSNTHIKSIGVFHALEPDFKDEVKDLLVEMMNVEEIYESEVGSVVGTHSGPGCVAVAFIYK
jgi:DegV family protein with EDD domain